MTETGLRDRIADAIRLRAIADTEWSITDLADAIVAELCITAEYGYRTSYPKWPVVDLRFVRYVTDWRADDA